MDFDENYLLGFVKNKNKCFSYAASVGLGELNDEEKAWLYKYIKDFNQILIREKTGQALIQKLGITDSRLVCDPTFLLDKTTWTSMENPISVPKHYILVYGFKENPNMKKCIEILKKKTHFPVCIISESLRNSRSGQKVLRGVGPGEWLYLIHNADYIVTNSFHGMIFSFIFNRQVMIGDSNDGTFSRMKDFLAEMKCMNCIIGEDIQSVIDNKIDYKQVNPKMHNYSTRSKRILKTILKGKQVVE